MGKPLRKACINSLSIAMPLVTAAFVLSHVLPPLSPNQGAASLSHYYLTHTTRLRIGALCGLIGAVGLAPFYAAVALEVKKMTRSDLAAYIQVMFGVMATLGLLTPWTWFAVAAFRPDRSPDVLFALHDLAFLPLYTCAAIFAFQSVYLCWAMRVDQRARRGFPGWFASFTVVVGVVNGLGVFVILTKDGPLAWNGVLAYWVPLVIFGAWTNLMTKYMKDSLNAEPDEAPEEIGGDTSHLDLRVAGLEVELAAFREQVAAAPRGA